MSGRILGTLTIGQAPRPDVVPILDQHIPARIERLHRGVLDRMTRAEIETRYGPVPGESLLITRLQDGSSVQLSRAKMREGVQRALGRLEDAGADVILLLCTGTFAELNCGKAWLVEPDHIIPPLVAGLLQQRQLGIVVPLAAQMESEGGKWAPLKQKPIFAAASPYGADDTALLQAGGDLKQRGAAALLLDCIGFTEQHRRVLAPLGLPLLLSNAVVARALGELLEV